MVKFINKWTGSEMWVAEDRVEEYKAAGHKVALPPVVVPKTVAVKPVSKPVTVKKTRKAR